VTSADFPATGLILTDLQHLFSYPGAVPGHPESAYRGSG
jgi:hypothetical protein